MYIPHVKLIGKRAEYLLNGFNFFYISYLIYILLRHVIFMLLNTITKYMCIFFCK